MVAVAVPVAIHLLNKFRVRETRWAAMRFVRESLQRNRRRLEIEDLLLLLLRCLIVLVVAAAFAQPVWEVLVPAGPGGSGAGAVAVVLDNSASMGQGDGLGTRFEEGKDSLLQDVEKRDPEAALALFLVSNRAEALIERPSLDRPLFRRSLELAALDDRSTDLLAGIRAGYEALKLSPAPQREVHVYTDSQASAWMGLPEIRKLREAHPGIGLKPVVLGRRGEDNLAIVELRPVGETVAGQPSRFRVEVANFGTTTAERVRVTIAVDDAPPSGEQLLDGLEPGAKRSVEVSVRFPATGPHSVTATIPPDRLAVDNQRSCAVEVSERAGILVVEGQPQGGDSERDGYFLVNALAPVAAGGPGDPPRIRTVPFASMNRAALKNFQTVFLCNPGVLPDATAEELKRYVEGGGNLVIFPGTKTPPAAWGSESRLAENLPAFLGAWKSAGPDPLALQEEGFEHPVTAIWNDPSSGGLGAVRYEGYFPLELAPPSPERAGPSVLLRLANGDPVAAERSVGQGHVVLFNGPALPDGNTLVLHPAFVALMQRLLDYLNEADGRGLNLAPGEAFEWPVKVAELGREFSVIRPGKDGEKRAAGQVEMSDQQAVLRFGDTGKVGAYRLFLGDDPSPAAVFAVQLDPAESDLRQAGTEEIATLALPVPEAGPADSPVVALRPKVEAEFWTILIWLAAFLIFLETLLSHHLSRAH
jgi:hypothetical protein